MQPLFVFSVGLEREAVVEALAALGERGERLILTSSLEVRLFLQAPFLPLASVSESSHDMLAVGSDKTAPRWCSLQMWCSPCAPG